MNKIERFSVGPDEDAENYVRMTTNTESDPALIFDGIEKIIHDFTHQTMNKR